MKFSPKATEYTLLSSRLNRIYTIYSNKKDELDNITINKEYGLNFQDFLDFIRAFDQSMEIKKKNLKQVSLFNYRVFFELERKENLFMWIIKNQKWSMIPELGKIFAIHRDFFEILFKKFRERIKIEKDPILKTIKFELMYYFDKLKKKIKRIKMYLLYERKLADDDWREYDE